MPHLSETQLEQLKALTTPAVANAIESFNLRLRNEGYTDRAILSRYARNESMLGYAITAKMRTSAPPMRGTHYPDRNDWWSLLQEAHAPKVIVIEDIDRIPGSGSVCGGMHGTIFKALGCVGIITNGAVRDLTELEAQQLHVYSGSLSPSHAYAHIAEVNTPVEVGGLRISPGDLLHGDRHGIVSVPLSIASGIPARALEQREHERTIIDYCKTTGLSLEKLRQLVSSLVPAPPEEKR